MTHAQHGRVSSAVLLPALSHLAGASNGARAAPAAALDPALQQARLLREDDGHLAVAYRPSEPILLERQRADLPTAARSAAGSKNEQKQGVFAHAFRGFEGSVASGPGQFGRCGCDGRGLRDVFVLLPIDFASGKCQVADCETWSSEAHFSDNLWPPKPMMGPTATRGPLLNA